VAVVHDAQTRFPATDGTVGVNSVDTTTGDRTFSHAGAADAKGAVVVLLCTGNTTTVTGVLYGGVAMTLEETANDTTEAGRVEVYVLADQASFPTGTQTVTLQGCTATQKWCTCSTVTCSVGTRSRLNASNFKDTTAAANPTLTVVTTATTLLYGGLHGGAASPASYVVTANYTSQFNNDYGALSARTSRRTSEVASGSIVYDFSFATSDDYCIAAVALEEYTPAPVLTPMYPVMAPRQA
jgi:hypothetical protein